MVHIFDRDVQPSLHFKKYQEFGSTQSSFQPNEYSDSRTPYIIYLDQNKSRANRVTEEQQDGPWSCSRVIEKQDFRNPMKAYYEQVRNALTHKTLQITGLCLSSLADAPLLRAEQVRKLSINMG